MCRRDSWKKIWNFWFHGYYRTILGQKWAKKDTSRWLKLESFWDLLLLYFDVYCISTGSTVRITSKISIKSCLNHVTKWKLHFPNPSPSSLIMHELWIMSQTTILRGFWGSSHKTTIYRHESMISAWKVDSIILKMSQRIATNIKVPFSKKPF